MGDITYKILSIKLYIYLLNNNLIIRIYTFYHYRLFNSNN